MFVCFSWVYFSFSSSLSHFPISYFLLGKEVSCAIIISVISFRINVCSQKLLIYCLLKPSLSRLLKYMHCSEKF